MTRQIEEIRNEIINESQNYNIFIKAANSYGIIDADTDAEGIDEAITFMKKRMRKLVLELKEAIMGGRINAD